MNDVAMRASTAQGRYAQGVGEDTAQSQSRLGEIVGALQQAESLVALECAGLEKLAGRAFGELPPQPTGEAPATPTRCGGHLGEIEMRIRALGDQLQRLNRVADRLSPLA